MRVPADVLRGIEREADRTGRPVTTLAADLLEEGLVMRTYPGIYFRQGAAGRRPALAGTRLDVWQVVDTVEAEGGDFERAAGYFDVAPGLIRSAMEYAADHREQIDAWRARERTHAAAEERRWRGSRRTTPR